jgi:hypothetical protein
MMIMVIHGDAGNNNKVIMRFYTIRIVPSSHSVPRKLITIAENYTEETVRWKWKLWRTVKFCCYMPLFESRSVSFPLMLNSSFTLGDNAVPEGQYRAVSCRDTIRWKAVNCPRQLDYSATVKITGKIETSSCNFFYTGTMMMMTMMMMVMPIRLCALCEINNTSIKSSVPNETRRKFINISSNR